MSVEDELYGKRLKDVTVPDIMRHRVSTGIAWLDHCLCKGLVPSTILMLTGMPGLGKSTLLLQMGDAFAKSGELTVLYNGCEEHPYQTKMLAERLEIEGDFVISQTRDVNELLALTNVLEEEYGKRVLILQDSMQRLVPGEGKRAGSTQSSLDCVKILTEWCKVSFGNCIFINQVTKGGLFVGKNEVEHDVDGHLDMYIDSERSSTTKGELLIEMLKYRWGSAHASYVLEMRKNGVYEKCPAQTSQRNKEAETET